jgi:phage terminase small subunit
MNPNETKPAKPRGGVQPKKQAAKNKAAVKMRRKKVIKAVLEGKTLQQAGIIAGYAPQAAYQQAAKTLQNPTIASKLLAEMEKNGMDDAYLSVKLRALIEGTKVIAANIFTGSGPDLADANSMTKDFVEVPDNVALGKGLEIACKIKGVFSEKREVDIKRPLTILVRRFCAEDDPPPPPSVSGSGGAGA